MWGSQFWLQPPFRRLFSGMCESSQSGSAAPNGVAHPGCGLPLMDVAMGLVHGAKNPSVARPKSRLKGGCSHDWLPHITRPFPTVPLRIGRLLLLAPNTPRPSPVWNRIDESQPMKHKLYTLILATASCSFAFQADKAAEIARWEKQARNITIIRDDWGIAHIYGKTDADAVFGMEYAQAEDDFNRVETNYITSLGRMAEVEGDSRIYQDLRMKLFVDPAKLKTQYAASPAWLQKLMDAYADGLNFYLHKHPELKPKLMTRFEPWMALALTEGSVPLGGDVDKVNLNQLQAFYGKVPPTQEQLEEENQPREPGGSNGMAVAPANTAAHHALLLINPHTSFFFRSELQMVSEEGLNAYGAATWASSSSTRVSTTAPAGCIPRAASMPWTTTWRR